MRNQLSFVFVDEKGEPFETPKSPEELILTAIRRYIVEGKPFRFEDCMKGIRTPNGRERKTYSYLLQPFINSGEITKVDKVHSSEPSHHWGTKTVWLRSDCVELCPTCKRPWHVQYA